MNCYTIFSLPLRTNRTQQGCLLFPLIFILMLEPFLCRISDNPDNGPSVGTPFPLKNGAYSDDLLFHHKPCAVPSEPFDQIGKLCITFQLLLNFQKAEALNIPIPESSTRYHKGNFPMKWKTSYIRYLGTNLLRNLEDTFRINFSPLFVSDQMGSVNLVQEYFSWIRKY